MEPTTMKVAAAVEVVRKRVQQVRDRKELIGEQNTKAALIDPLLTAMGWELQEIDEVRIPTSIEFVHAPIPAELEMRLRDARQVASREVLPAQ
jgi:hypothetical protein